MTRSAVVICPGRGTYNKAELGYLKRHHADKAEFIGMVDDYRANHDQLAISALDGAERYSVGTFSRGDNASPLIYACAYSDFLSIDRSRFEIVAVTGNSMGWYIALTCAGALSPFGGMDVVNTMGTFMQESLIGGQLVYPFVDADWREIPGRRDDILEHVRLINARSHSSLYVSIELGGMLVLAGNEEGLTALETTLPRIDQRFPMRLANHAAFHTPLQEPISERGRAALGQGLFRQPDVAMVDGRGRIWYPWATDLTALGDYTLGHQVTQTYDFTAAVHTSVREFAPDCLIVLGPGNTLGGAVAQSLISCGWDGLSGKADFSARQASEPLLISMGLDEQRQWAVS
ncbi:ACP S-malonyltransferase [Hoeflea prorocentri]|uniref:[acyl-carrier-protein] S-malonyltransferase n=1 Tax=Hoeflea prorocentri TaxID=1922333 RepID=A0A9X3ZHU2_9HYPH|nr:ACP S-malonyltransferase [Hoeflea prorocentri]MCY6381283.1 ACP S-malonyltransferase [Hoeflea prorocentri]MDA5399083.1 ACP S-malonyltransferase [Hoeflea prorocentri]